MQRIKRYFLMVLLVIAFASGAWAADEQVVELPLIYSQGGSEVKTSACLRIRERIYADSWTDFKNKAQAGPEKALLETITAIQQKDIPRLKELSHPEFVRDAENFKMQTSAYLKQFEVLQLGNVWGYYRLSDKFVFFLQLDYKGKSNFLDFPFVREDTRKFGFFRSSDASLQEQLVGDWFQSPWGPAKSQPPVYCEPSLIRKMTHEIVMDETEESDSQVRLLLIGCRLYKDGPYTDLFGQIAQMKESLTHNRMNEFFDGFTEHDRKRNRDWFLAETEENLRTQYIENFVAQEPFYVFDADPLYVVYIRTKSLSVDALYFVRQGEQQIFRLTTESVGSSFDRIFRSKKFIEAASEEKPFDKWKIGEKKQLGM